MISTHWHSGAQGHEQQKAPYNPLSMPMNIHWENSETTPQVSGLTSCPKTLVLMRMAILVNCCYITSHHKTSNFNNHNLSFLFILRAAWAFLDDLAWAHSSDCIQWAAGLPWARSSTMALPTYLWHCWGHLEGWALSLSSWSHAI